MTYFLTNSCTVGDGGLRLLLRLSLGHECADSHFPPLFPNSAGVPTPQTHEPALSGKTHSGKSATPIFMTHSVCVSFPEQNWTKSFTIECVGAFLGRRVCHVSVNEHTTTSIWAHSSFSTSCQPRRWCHNMRAEMMGGKSSRWKWRELGFESVH